MDAALKLTIGETYLNVGLILISKLLTFIHQYLRHMRLLGSMMYRSPCSVVSCP